MRPQDTQMASGRDPDEGRITIPPEAVEAAAIALMSRLMVSQQDAHHLWSGMYEPEKDQFRREARADVAPDVQDKLNAAVRKVMASPKLEEFLKQRGAIPSTMTLSQFKSFFNQEVDTWAEVIRKADIKAE